MKIAIQGHPTRGKEVIKTLENLGGKNRYKLFGDSKVYYYFINKDKNIDIFSKYNVLSDYKRYTLEEFKKEFPFKIRDIVQTVPNGQMGVITELCLDPIHIVVYKIRYKSKKELLFPSIMLKLYKPMKEERNITLTLDKAKEWYKQGGDLKEVALQAFTEQELNPIPKSWEEYCKMYSSQAAQSIFIMGHPKKYIALWKLEQLRDCYRQEWKPDWTKNNPIFSIYSTDKEIDVALLFAKHFLSFQSREVAKEFLKNFKYLIEEAGDLIS